MNVIDRLRKRVFDGIEVMCMATGSAIYGTEEPNDLDYIGLFEEGIHDNLATLHGWEDHGSADEEEYAVSYTKGFINLVLGSEEFVARWIEAHDVLMDSCDLAATKEGRVALFKVMRAGFDFEPA